MLANLLEVFSVPQDEADDYEVVRVRANSSMATCQGKNWTIRSSRPAHTGNDSAGVKPSRQHPPV
jgi:hypothetical protein